MDITAIVNETENIEEFELESVKSRVLASIIDGAVIFVIIIITYLAADNNLKEEIESSSTIHILYVLLILIIHFVINYKFLISKGQTIGKKLLKIQVVSSSGNIASFPSLILRGLIFTSIWYIPIIGGVIGFVSILLVFTKKRLCLHDIFAKTKVVSINNRIKKSLLGYSNDKSSLDVRENRFFQSNILWRRNKLSDWMAKLNLNSTIYVIKYLHSLGFSKKTDILDLEQKMHAIEPLMSKLIRITMIVAIVSALII